MRWMVDGRSLSLRRPAAGLVLVVLTLHGCAAELPARPRAVDVHAARITALAHPLPPHMAQAFFALDTGADQAGGWRREAGLVVVLRAGAREERRTVASCREPSLGSALGDRAAHVLDIAFCGGEFQLHHDARRLAVVRIEPAGGQRTVIDLPLPADVDRIVGEAP